jgi:hypothetical protein
MFQVMYQSAKDLHEKFDRSDRCFAIMDGEDIQAYCWVQFGTRSLDGLYVDVDMAPDQGWLYNAITMQSARGRGIYPNLIRHMAKRLAADGFREFFIDVDARNVPSLRGLDKVGCRQIAVMRMTRTLSRPRYTLQVLEPEPWQRLSEQFGSFRTGQHSWAEIVDGN